jgi:biopolymer transport protein ExbD
MNDEHVPETESNEEDVAPVFFRRPLKDSVDLDITPMIDIVFLLLIFFLVASIPDPSSAVQLPPARYGEGVSERNAVIITVAQRDGSGKGLVYLADGKVGNPLTGTKEEQAQAIAKTVQEGVDQNKTAVLVKAERGVLHREVSSVTAAVGRVEGISLHLAVLESD